jgi:FkbM family methyltransferase
MTRRRLSSLILDEFLSRVFTRVRARAARQVTFRGLVVPVDDLIGLRVMATGMFEATQIEGLTRLLEEPETFGLNGKPTGIFVDIGANIGIYTVAFSHFFDLTIAVEAHPKTFSVLRANTALRDIANVKCLNLAASDSAGLAKLYVPNDGNLGHATMTANQHASFTEVSIECRTLDSIMDEHAGGRPIGLIKMDVEGHELKVLKGARRTLLRYRPPVLFEALSVPDAKECAELLFKCGYTRLFTFRRGREGGRLSEILVGLAHGLDVYAKKTTIESIRKSALICAVAD